MSVRIAINGYGRIGRNVLRALYEGDKRNDLQIVAINGFNDVKAAAHLTRNDTTHGRFPYDVVAGDGVLIVDGDEIHLSSERDPLKLPWKKVGVDIVLECTGSFNSKEKSSAHLKAGASKVIISAFAGTGVDATVVYGVNHHILKASDQIISGASCTTNCLAPLAKVLHEAVGIEQGLMTTIHAYTNDQVLMDVYHSDLRRARSATQSMIPTKTGAASAVGLVLPELNGRIDGFAMRVPTINVSIVDLTFTAGRATSAEELNEAVLLASQNELNGVLACTDEPLVSIDFNHDPVSSTLDAGLTKVSGNLAKVCAWYDNEWGYSNRMLDLSLALANAK
ncbi:MAG: type I glyceraldehyde-3-phosphate dehydrogenase [Gammaproteobacteria bacterium]|nr:type I glyceraldehyde-3-phosphate dehydrogenase [Gammaproteobacteria bacterium]|tara:strand:- start:559 stop:1569 length:1011 start_codon:yes stop_codon:yes gene_type:complete